MSTDEDLASLAKQARDGDSEAWAEIYRAMAPSIFRLCRRALPTRPDAEDATGEVFLKARMRLAQYDASVVPADKVDASANPSPLPAFAGSFRLRTRLRRTRRS